MREGAAKTLSLLDNFTTFLQRLGIHVVFDADDHDDESFVSRPTHDFAHVRPRSPASLQDESLAFASTKLVDHGRTPPQTPGRRTSFTNLEDTMQSHREGRRESRPISKAAFGPRSSSAGVGASPAVIAKGAVANLPLRSALKPPTATNHSPKLSRDNRDAVVSIREEPSLYEFDQLSPFGDTGLASIMEIAAQPESLSIEQRHGMSRKLRFHFLAAKACAAFWKWRNEAKSLRISRSQLHHQAVSHDRKILAQQSIDQWRSSLAQLRAEQETEKFFESLETRAGEARDLYLLTKAFTHWAQCTADELAHTNSARAHILKTRCFRSWRDITVVNELKVRHRGLTKFLGLWRKRNGQVAHLQSEADVFRTEHVAVNAYRNWFWGFCDRRAPAYYSSRLLSKAFEKWSSSASSLHRRHAWTENFANLEIKRRAFNRLRSRLSARQALEGDATSFRRGLLLAGSFRSMQRASEFDPMVRAFQQEHDNSQARSALAAWHRQTCLKLQAREANETRLMRVAFVAWNDELRCRFMRRSIDDRLLMQALYYWAVSERLKIAERVLLDSRRVRYLNLWRDRLEQLCGSLGKAEHQHTVSTRERMKKRLFHCWREKSDDLDSMDGNATRRYDQRLVIDVTSKITLRHQKLKEAQLTSNDVRFYKLCSGALSKWREAAVSSRKAKRREAYSKFRREMKVKNAKAVLGCWKQKTDTHCASTQLAQDIQHDVSKRTASRLVGQWRAKAGQADQAYSDAERQCSERRLRDTLAKWTSRTASLDDLARQADSLAGEWTDAKVAQCLSRLAWHVFQIRRHNDTAESFAGRLTRKHRRQMLRHWSERLSMHAQPDFAQTATMSDDLLDDNDAGTDALNAGEMSFGRHGPLVAATPAYMKTPSRRTGRARLPTSASAVPPATSQITPFLTRLRDVYPRAMPSTSRLPRTSAFLARRRSHLSEGIDRG